MAEHPKLTTMTISVFATLALGAIIGSLEGGQAWAATMGKCHVMKDCISF